MVGTYEPTIAAQKPKHCLGFLLGWHLHFFALLFAAGFRQFYYVHQVHRIQHGSGTFSDHG